MPNKKYKQVKVNKRNLNSVIKFFGADAVNSFIESKLQQLTISHQQTDKEIITEIRQEQSNILTKLSYLNMEYPSDKRKALKLAHKIKYLESIIQDLNLCPKTNQNKQ